MSSDFTEARLGLEARGCRLDGVLCAVGGLDLGYRHERLVAEFDGERADLVTASPASASTWAASTCACASASNPASTRAAGTAWA